MNSLQKVRLRLRALFQKEKLDAHMDEEMRSHVEMQTQENIENGMKAEEARYAALRQFGWVESIKETCREQRGVSWIETLIQDVRFGGRILRKNPGFATVAVLTLAMGIGANTAIFSVVNAVLLQPLPYPGADRLVSLCERGPDGSAGPISYPNFTDWKEQQSVFESFGVYNWNNFALTGKGEPAQLRGAQVSADVFAALGLQPEIGRVFRLEEDRPGAPTVAIISHSLWENRFGGSPGIVNESMTLNGKVYTVLAVMPSGFQFPNEVDLWVPVGPLSTDPDWQNRGHHPGLQGLARLKPGVTLEKARADLDAIAVRLEQQYPDSNRTRRVQINTLLDDTVGNVRSALWILLGAVSLVLIIACANVANLVLARGAAREKEMAVRAALGAGQWRITRQLLTESLLLAMFGAGAGLLFAKRALHLILALARESLPRSAEVGLDSRVLLFSGFVAVLTGILFGLAPAYYAGRPDLHRTLKEVGRGTTSGRARLRQGLVVAEVALTFVLLIGAGLLLVSFHRLLQVNPGFAVEHLLIFQLNLPPRKYPKEDQQIHFYKALLEKLRALPGVQTASITSHIPLDEKGWDTPFLIEGRPESPPQERPFLQVHLVAPDYFRAMAIPIRQGRDFSEQDNKEHRGANDRETAWAGALNAIIIDEEFANRHWPGQNPLGQRVRLPWAKDHDKEPLVTVVGVVGRVKEHRLSEKSGMVQAYFPFLQQPSGGMTVVIKTTVEPISILNTVRQQVSQLDLEQPIFGIHTVKEMRYKNVAPERVNVGLLSAFAGLALGLAVIGLYGVLAFDVTQRQREIGVRMALGAQRSDVWNLVVGQGMRLFSIGVAIGLLGSFALTRFLRSVLFDVEPTDPLTFCIVTITLCTVALLACYVPARRATRVDPMEALRYE